MGSLLLRKLLVVVCDFNLISISFIPNKTYSILLIYSYTILIISVTFQLFQTISRRYFEFIQILNSI